jgi:hypothetical protein
MEFPSTFEFLEMFGIEPTEDSPECCRYVKQSSDGQQELVISFGAVTNSFQVVLRCDGKNTMTVSSERVRSIKLCCNKSGSGIHVVFDICGVTSEACVILEPDLHCQWWTLQSQP